MTTNDLYKQSLSTVDINEAISYLIVDNDATCIEMHDSLCELISAKKKTSWRIICSKLEEQENEYRELVGLLLNELNIDYSKQRVILALEPSKLPVGFIPYMKYEKEE